MTATITDRAAMAAAAAIAASLATAAEPLTAEQCQAHAARYGHSRAEARAGLRWAVDTGLIRRRPGYRKALLHALAGPPMTPPSTPESARNVRIAVRDRRRSTGQTVSAPNTARDDYQATGSVGRNRAADTVVDHVLKIHTTARPPHPARPHHRRSQLQNAKRP